MSNYIPHYGVDYEVGPRKLITHWSQDRQTWSRGVKTLVEIAIFFFILLFHFFFFFFWGGGGGHCPLILTRSNWSQKSNLPQFEFIHTINRHQLKLWFLNLDQKCILALLSSLLFWAWLILTFNFIILKPILNRAFCIYSVRPSQTLFSETIAGFQVTPSMWGDWKLAEGLNQFKEQPIGTALCHRLFHRATLSWCGHFGCATFWAGGWSGTSVWY